MFEKQGTFQPMNLRYLDMPFFYHHSELGFEFVNALEECENLDLFKLPSVQIMIDSQMDYWYNVIGFGLALPLILQLIIFWYYSNVVISHVLEEPEWFI